MKKFALIPIILTALAIPSGSGAADKDISTPLKSYEAWPEEAVEIFENLLVQDGGRVKPVYSFARFTLMQFIGGTKVKFSTQDGVDHKIKQSEWLMDVLLRGEVARELPTFIVDDSEAVIRIGVSPKSKRDRYSYAQLLPGRAKLADLAAQYAEKQEKWESSEKDPQYELDRIERMVLRLGRNVSSYEYLLGQFGYARGGEFIVNEDIIPEELRELSKTVNMTEMLDKMPEMTLDQLVQMIRQQPGASEDEKLFSGAMRLFFFHANSGRGLSMFPPQEHNENAHDGHDHSAVEVDARWNSIGEVMLLGLQSKEDRSWAIEQMKSVQSIIDAKGDDEKIVSALKEFSDQQKTKAAEHDQGLRSGMEVGLYKGNYFVNALVFFILAFLVMAFSWLAPGSKYGRIMALIAIVCTIIGLLLDIYGITLRSIIRSRPPITNLYDTVLFITAAAVFLGLMLEYFTRMGVGLLVAVVAGILGMFLSIKYEAKEATDTIGQLVAVLDTNFWLATHVTIINFGYGAALVAGFLGMYYLAGRFFSSDSDKEKKDFFKKVTRMNYGIICFCLFFSLVGTVLGGIWANYSWGRFWGWDPKENGALMICLWCLVILHARMGGMIRDIGVNVNAIILAGITTFSWWGVNNLGVGLHSYGFTDGIWGKLFSSWAIMGVFILMGIPLLRSDRQKKAEKSSSATVKA